MAHVAITFSFFPSVLHSSVGGAGDDWVVATDDDDLVVDQTDIGLTTVHTVVDNMQLWAVCVTYRN